MKLKFDSNLEYQLEAIATVTDLFEGLPSKESDFSVSLSASVGPLPMEHTELGIGNRLLLDTDRLLKNLHAIQEENNLTRSRFLAESDDAYKFPNFSVEMETGTGKTYVYLRSIFELNRKYGFKKFIIVVPSVAIREGVLSSIELMGGHFKGLYDNVPFDHFVYNSKDLSKVRQFAVSNEIQIMIINIQAFQKDTGEVDDYSKLSDEQIKKLNVIHQEQDKMSGRRPIEYVRAANPIVIIDEPQSVDNTPKARKAINTLNPLFCLRYSATHANPYNLLYKLDPIRAYDMRLVKQIEVASICAEENFNEVFIRLDSIDYAKGATIPHAKVSIHEDTNKNGDHFTVEELSSRYQTAINKKIDLKHAQDITDIVGGVVASDFVQDEKGSRVECVGELYTQDSENSRLAYKLMKKGIITQVSMECDYQEGECSICGKRFTNKADYCIHLKKYKSGQFEGKPVYEILHGVTFTGLGLLDKKGADENAKITAVSDLTDNQKNGGNKMPEQDEKDKQKLEDDAAKKESAPPVDEKDKDTLIKKLQSENQKLKQQVADLQKQVEKYESEAKAAARKVKAEKLIGKLEQKGMGFSDQEREAELKRLSELSDDAFAATEAAYERMPTAGKKEKEQEDKEKDKKGKKETTKSKADGDDKTMRTDAGVKPLIVDDPQATLETKLKTGFKAAYQERIGKAA